MYLTGQPLAELSDASAAQSTAYLK